MSSTEQLATQGEPNGSEPSSDPTHLQDHGEQIMPSQVTSGVGVFDRFAGHASRIASRAPFFAFCVFLVVIWLPSYFVLKDIDTWQLIINTLTTIVTFLLVALLQNSQYRTDEATQHKLNAIAGGLADLMEHLGEDELQQEIRELERAVGLERRESSD